MPLSADAIVVRGGTEMTVERVTYLLEEAVADGDGAVISVYAEDAEPGEDLAVTLERISRTADLPHRQIQISALSRLVTNGLDVVPAIDAGEASNHHHVVFDYPIDTVQVAAFVEAWDGPVLNPTGGKRRQR